MTAGEPGDLPQPQGLRYSVRAFRHRDFAMFWSGAFVSNIGGWLQNLTVPFVIFHITGSALWVGLVSACQFLPQVLLGPWGGVLADRYHRRRMLFVTQTGLALTALLLWLVVRSGVEEPVAIMAVVAIAGCFQGINMPSWQSFVNDLVPRRDLPSAVALNSFQFNASRAIGPAIAGILLALFGPSWALLINAVSFGAVLLALALVRVDSSPRTEPDRSSVTRQFIAAVRYIRTQPGIMMGLLLAIVVGLLINPIFQFTVVFAGSVFEVGAAQLGLMNAALGLGAVIATPLVAGWSHVFGLARLARWALFVQVVGMAAFALSPTPLLAGVALVLVGGGFLMAMSSSNTAIQMIVADPVRGRVLAARIMAYTLTVPIGNTVQGAISDAIGPRATVLGAAGVLMIVTIVLSLWRGPTRFTRLMDPRDCGDGRVAASA